MSVAEIACIENKSEAGVEIAYPDERRGGAPKNSKPKLKLNSRTGMVYPDFISDASLDSAHRLKQKIP